MGRIFLFCVTCCFLFLVVPPFVHGEKTGASTDPTIDEEAGKSQSVLFDNLKRVDNVLKDTTESIEAVLQETVKSKDKTLTDSSELSEIEPVTSRIEVTGNFLIETVESTVPLIEKTADTVINTMEETTSEVANVVNDTVNSVVYELPTVPVVNPIVYDKSETVKKAIPTVQTVVENTGKLVNETLHSTIDVSHDVVIETVDTVDKGIKLPQVIIESKNDEQTIITNGSFNSRPKEHNFDGGSVPELEPTIPVVLETGLDVLDKQVGTSELEKHNDIRLDDDIEISLNGEVNLVVDLILGETSVDRQSVIQELNMLKRTNGLTYPFVNSKTDVLEEKIVDNPNLPTESRKIRSMIPAAIITETPPPAASYTFATGGQSDLGFLGMVDEFSLKSSSGWKWIDTNEDAPVLWAHAPPRKPPQQSPYFNVK